MKMNKKGFTLAELLIVIAIMAILIAIAIPVFSAQLEKARHSVDDQTARSGKSLAEAHYLLVHADGKQGDGTTAMTSDTITCCISQDTQKNLIISDCSECKSTAKIDTSSAVGALSQVQSQCNDTSGTAGAAGDGGVGKNKYLTVTVKDGFTTAVWSDSAYTPAGP